jgi:DNA-binding cell septation regulator SpoVG
MNVLSVSSVRLVRAHRDPVNSTLLGWVSFRLGGEVKVDGVALHRSQAGRYSLAFPERTDRQGGRHAVICPITDSARRAIEQQVFAALGLEVHP